MNLQQYKNNIKNKLIAGLNQQSMIDNKIKNDRKPMKSISSNNYSGGSLKPNKFVAKEHVLTSLSFDPSYYGEDQHDKDLLENMYSKNNLNKLEDKTPRKTNKKITGGKLNIGKDLHDVGMSFAKAGASIIGKETGTAIVNGIKNFGNSVASEAPVIGTETAEVAPEAMLLAAGMNKKPKRNRTISEKEKKRHQLIRQLMQKHNINLSQASKFIKSKNIKY
jgi:hypothetical protein